MWASPSNVPTRASFVSSGIVIFALSAADNLLIPFVEPAAGRAARAPPNQPQAKKNCGTNQICNLVDFIFIVKNYI